MMLEQPLQDIDAWVKFFSDAELPILRQTLRRLDEARAKIDSISGREIAAIVLQDPLLTVRVLSHIQPLSGKRLHSDITNIGNAIMMLGIEPFFESIATPTTLESLLQDERQALLGALQAIRRMQRASRYAHDWAFERHELNIDEVTVAALLHDLPEILLWCFAPKLAMEIRDLQQAEKGLRSGMAQEQVLGIRLFDLLHALCDAWHLPLLLKTLMDDAKTDTPRIQNVALAVNLARHTANGWDHPRLPSDFEAIEKLLHLERETLLKKLDVPESLFATYLVQPPKGDDIKPPSSPV